MARLQKKQANFLNKTDLIVETHNNLTNKNEDVEFRELRHIFIQKEKAINKIKRIKEKIRDDIEARYMNEIKRLDKKKSVRKKLYYF